MGSVAGLTYDEMMPRKADKLKMNGKGKATGMAKSGGAVGASLQQLGSGGCGGGVVPRVAVVVSRYNDAVTDKLLEGALEAYERAGGSLGKLLVIDAPGSFEVVTLAERAIAIGGVDGVCALGCIIKGQTAHDVFLGHAVTSGLVQVSVMTGVPVTTGVLTVNTQGQAVARAGGKSGSKVVNNKGYEAMTALLMTIRQIRMIGGVGNGVGVTGGAMSVGAGGKQCADGSMCDGLGGCSEDGK